MTYLLVLFPPYPNGPGEQAGSLPDDRLHEKSGNKFAASHRVQMFNQHFIRALDHGVKPCLTCFGDVKDGIFLNMEDKVTKSTSRQFVDISLLQLRLVGDG